MFSLKNILFNNDKSMFLLFYPVLNFRTFIGFKPEYFFFGYFANSIQFHTCLYPLLGNGVITDVALTVVRVCVCENQRRPRPDGSCFRCSIISAADPRGGFDEAFGIVLRSSVVCPGRERWSLDHARRLRFRVHDSAVILVQDVLSPTGTFGHTLWILRFISPPPFSKFVFPYLPLRSVAYIRPTPGWYPVGLCGKNIF